jgi:endonuclease/exonuclease/phosphatase (EEP) superfamily protein YafD
MAMISVLSYNVYFGKRIDKIIYWLLKQPTYDVMCFQEFPKQAITPFIKAFSRANYGYRYAPFLVRRRTTYGELTMFRKDKLTLVKSSTVFLGLNSGERVLLRARTPRTSILTIFRYKKYEIALVNVHLVNVAFNALRYKQITTIISKLSNHSIPSILLGDFNMSSMFGRRRFFMFMEQCGYERPVKRITTHRLAVIKQQMDYIFWKDCRVNDVIVERVKFSDHYPLTFTVSVR